MGDNFQDVITPHSPRVLEDTTTATGIMDFLSVGKNQSFSRGDAPHQSNIMLLTATSSSCLTGS